MAKLDDIKSKQPDSRLTSLGTTFRPGQKRIALPTSKQLSSPLTENETPLQNVPIAPTLHAGVFPSVDTTNSKLVDFESTPSVPGTTRHIHPAQLGTSTQHNSAQLNHLSALIETPTDLKIESEKIRDINQPGTTRHNSTSNNCEYFQSETECSDLNCLSITEKNSEDDEFIFILKDSDNPAHLNTTTRHNSHNQPGTTRHTSAQIKNFEEKANRKPGTTRHNPTPGPAQPDTTTRYNPTHKKLSNEIYERIHNLSGTSALILSFLCKNCLENGTNRVTISYKMLAELTGTKFSSIPTTCKRLRTAGFFELSGSKGGAQAVRNFDFSDQLIKAFANEILNLKQIGINNSQPGTTRHINPAQPDTWASTTAPSMYVGINNNTIHTELTAPIPPLPDEWAKLREIDFSALFQWNIKESVVDTFKKNKWLVSREQLEDFIERFIRYFTEPEFESRRASIRSPYSLFLNSVKAISMGEPDPICDVKTQFEIQRDIALKNKQKQLEDNRHQFEAFEKSMEQYRDSEFMIWVSKMNPEEQVRLVSPQPMAQVGSLAYRQLLKVYYTEQIWPEFKQTILNGPRA